MARELTEAQRYGLKWLYRDGSHRSWSRDVPGMPAISSMQALVRKGLASKRGGEGWTARFALTDAGRAALEADDHG